MYDEFRLCPNLEYIHFGKSLKRFNTRLHECPNVAEFDVDPENETYYSENGVLYSKDKKTLLRVPPTAETFDIFPVEIIANRAFYSCENLTVLNLPESVKTVKGGAIINTLSNLKYIVLPEGLETIEADGLSAQSERGSSWYDGSEVYDAVSRLAGCVIAKSTAVAEISEYAFTGREGWTLWVPSGCAEAYSAAAGWNIFANIVEGPQEIKVSCSIAEAGIVSGAGIYEPCETIALSYTPLHPDLYEFKGWYAGDELISESADCELTLLKPLGEIRAVVEPIADAAADYVKVSFVDGHIIIDIKSVEDAAVYETSVYDVEGNLLATVRTEVILKAPRKAAGLVGELIDPEKADSYVCKAYDSTGNLLAHYIGKVNKTITGLDAIEAVSATTVFDLGGRRVATPGRGLYIINNRKTLLR